MLPCDCTLQCLVLPCSTGLHPSGQQQPFLFPASKVGMHAHIAPVPSGAEVELCNGDRLRCKAIIGADGAKSFIAAKLGLPPAKYCGEVYYRWACRHAACVLHSLPT
jgi:2-polyprenyl-6-methoxyphenol hydroxylase-like FAD-dependent oxidoreductase